jgi:transcriptional regulator with XRE-family HTH domain
MQIHKSTSALDNEEMTNLIEKFRELCRKKGTTPYLVAQEVGVDNSLVSSWINGRRTPRPATMMEILQKFASCQTLDTDFETLAAWWAADFIPIKSFEIGAKEAQEALEDEKREIS